MTQYRAESLWPVLMDALCKLAVGLPVPSPVPGGPQEPWGPSGIVRERAGAPKGRQGRKGRRSLMATKAAP